MKKILAALILCTLLCAYFAQRNLRGKSDTETVAACKDIPVLSISDAKNFGIDSCGKFRILWVRNGPSSSLRWILLDSLAGALPPAFAELPKIKIPANRIVALSSTYLGYLKLLGVEDRVVGIDSRKYVADSSFYARVKSGNVKEVGGADVSPETIFELSPHAVFAFSAGNSVYDVFPKLERLQMPVVLTAEWTERSPLAKAEWIKFFGILSGKEALADSLFFGMKARYEALRARLDSIATRPVVFTGTPSFGTWFASPGDSYMANLIRDAGGKYLWASDTSDASLSMPFEQVFRDVQKADVWLNPGGALSAKELLVREPRLERFPVWTSGEIYEYDLRKGPEGGLDFYESAVVKPDSLLLDVAKILHPADFRLDSPKWYRKLSNI